MEEMRGMGENGRMGKRKKMRKWRKDASASEKFGVIHRVQVDFQLGS